jgi:hypothetical protein
MSLACVTSIQMPSGCLLGPKLEKVEALENKKGLSEVWERERRVDVVGKDALGNEV